MASSTHRGGRQWAVRRGGSARASIESFLMNVRVGGRNPQAHRSLFAHGKEIEGLRGCRVDDPVA
jgi:hypothetical protein